jgi:hypothetical protein
MSGPEAPNQEASQIAGAQSARRATSIRGRRAIKTAGHGFTPENA